MYMERDFGLIRKILLYIQKHHNGLELIEKTSKDTFDEFEFDTDDVDRIIYNFKLAFWKNLIRGDCELDTSRGPKNAFIRLSLGELTWEGHDFLEGRMGS